MCGVGGFLWLGGGRAPFDIDQRLARMIATLRHRGPDDEGIWSDGTCGLAHARLSIIDLSCAGHQPISSANGRVWLSYNGEIYNFRELRAELQARGYVFRSETDSEVIVNGYVAWGDGVLNRLRGMFAFALWDGGARRLLLARDRIGEKPLYYAKVGNLLLFGSEIKAILSWPDVERRPDYVAIDQYLSLQYVPAPRTAFAGIEKMRSAHKLVAAASTSGWEVGEQAAYWRLPAPGKAFSRRASSDLAGELVERIRDTVRLRLMSDVPLGAFLSGGIDSSTVVAFMADLGQGPVKTFSIGFAEKGYDETAYARQVATRFATEHEELIVEPDAVGIIPRLAWHYGEPFADPSAVPTYYLAQMTRRKVAVALSGDGGDEAFMGYQRYRWCRQMAQLDRLPPWLRSVAACVMRSLPGPVQRRYGYRLSALADLIAGSDRRASQRYALAIAAFTDAHKRQGYTASMADQSATSALDLIEPYFAQAPNLAAGANWSDIHTYLPDDLMVKVDVASMAHGLETRAPLLDHQLLEWSMGLPDSVKMSGGMPKSLLKTAMRPHLPPGILDRPKMGFGVPLDRWFRAELHDMAQDILLSRSAASRGIFAAGYVRQLLDEHVAGARNHQFRLWALLMLEWWFRTWIDQPLEAALGRH